MTINKSIISSIKTKLFHIIIDMLKRRLLTIGFAIFRITIIWKIVLVIYITRGKEILNSIKMKTMLNSGLTVDMFHEGIDTISTISC